MEGDRETLEALGAVYKQLNAPFGLFGKAAIAASTQAVGSNDQTHAAIDTALEALNAERDALAATIRSALHGAEFEGARVHDQDARAWIRQGEDLIARAVQLALP